jgi:ribosomal protein S18 acetylase RimI-like enzyme
MKRKAIAALDLLTRRKTPRPALRPARPVDYAFARQLMFSTMRDLVEEAVGWNEYRMDAGFARQFDMSKARIVTLGGRDIGWIQSQGVNDEIEIPYFFILPEHQGQGIGGAILNQLLALAQKQGKPVSLSVMKRNRAIEFYRQHGFRITHEGPHEFDMRLEPKPSLRGIGPSMGMRRG